MGKPLRSILFFHILPDLLACNSTLSPPFFQSIVYKLKGVFRRKGKTVYLLSYLAFFMIFLMVFVVLSQQSAAAESTPVRCTEQRVLL